MVRSLSVSLVFRGVLGVAAAVIAGVAWPGAAVAALVFLFAVQAFTGAASQVAPGSGGVLTRRGRPR